MGLRSRRGAAAKTGRIGSMVEVQPLDEQGPGVQAPLLVEAPGERKPNGQLLPGSRTTQSLGGKARKRRSALASDPAIALAQASPEFQPFQSKGVAFAKAVRHRLAQTCGGGECDELTAAVVSIAADQLAAQKFFTARAAKSLDPADFTAASRLGDAARQNLIAARELSTKHGHARAEAAAKLTGATTYVTYDDEPDGPPASARASGEAEGPAESTDATTGSAARSTHGLGPIGGSEP